MPTFMTAYKTSIYASYPAIWARLMAGLTVNSESEFVKNDPELASEISEGGGCIWFCDRCRSVCSPNRPCGCYDDECGCELCTAKWQAERGFYAPPTKEELKAWADEDEAYEREEDLEREADRKSHVRVKY